MNQIIKIAWDLNDNCENRYELVYEIAELAKLEGSEINKAKEALAFELTKLIHGEEEAQKAQEAARALFGAKTNTANMPTTELTEEDFTDGAVGVLDLLVKCGLAASKGEGRRLVQQGGVSVNDVKVTDIAHAVTVDEVKNEVIIKKGKKVFHKVIIK